MAKGRETLGFPLAVRSPQSPLQDQSHILTAREFDDESQTPGNVPGHQKQVIPKLCLLGTTHFQTLVDTRRKYGGNNPAPLTQFFASWILIGLIARSCAECAWPGKHVFVICISSLFTLTLV